MGKRISNVVRAIIVVLTAWVLIGIQVAYSDTILQEVNTKKYPTVKLLLSGAAFDEAGKAGNGDRTVRISENGQLIKSVHISPLTAKPKPIAVTLLIDSSGSMKGKPIEDAKAAADHFVRLMGIDDQICVIAFNSKPHLATDYSSNKKKIISSMSTIQASGETAVYDALSLAAQQIKKSGLKQKYIILLSDGGDTVSSTKPLTCIDQLKDLKVPVYTIALKSPEFDMGTLESISSQSGGKLLQAINSTELKPFYSRIAEQIKNNIEIEYRSPGF
ncbi:MAG: vWA domain-containing protein, partial [Candidatus Aquicultor sp.]